MGNYAKIPLGYYQSEDTIFLGRNLLGKYIFSNLHGEGLTGGIITETEAYMGPLDKACHAYNNRRTKRTEVMYKPGGVCYIYLCYGMHHLFNIVTHKKNMPHAILIRAIEPVVGTEIMLKRCRRQSPKQNWTSGPGILTKALGITLAQNGFSLDGEQIWLEDRGLKIVDEKIEITPRIGIDYAEEYVDRPWRFLMR